MKRFQTSLLELISTSRSGASISPTSTERSDEHDERLFQRLKLFFEPYPEFRLLLGDTAPAPIRILTITRNGATRDGAGSRSGSEPVRQFAVMIERTLFSRANSEWIVPTLLRLIRAVAKEGIEAADLRSDDFWIDRLFRTLSPRIEPAAPP